MKKNILLSFIVGLAACGGESLSYEPFKPITQSVSKSVIVIEGTVDPINKVFWLSLTDGHGPTACGLAQDFTNSLGRAGRQILMMLLGTKPCPVGLHSIRSVCPAQPQKDEVLGLYPLNCAYFRKWDAKGSELGFIKATSGALTVGGDQSSCTFDMELGFAGEAFSNKFTFTNFDPGPSQPACVSAK